MRIVGEFEEERQAKVFSDLLVSQGIGAEADRLQSGAWVVWAHDEDRMADAEAMLAKFRGAPVSAFEHVREEAEQVREAERRAEEDARKRTVEVARRWRKERGLGWVTGFLIALSFVVTLAVNADPEHSKLRWMLISLHYPVWQRPLAVDALDEEALRAGEGTAGFLIEVRQGQVWRLWTPIFVHFGYIHLLFNMLWLKDLGTMIERRQGAGTLLLLVAVIGLLSNLAQYIGAGPAFGGMSGVVYGLLGYVWLRGKMDSRAGVFLPHDVVLMMGIWYFLCLFGIIPHVANWAHTGGLGGGLAWGWVSGKVAARGRG